MIGKSLTHYEVLEKLGEGGMGIVYKARDTRLNRLAALKVLPPDKMADEGRRARFIQEAQAASALNHPNIVTIYEIDRDGPEGSATDFIAMEFIAGQTLDAAISRHGLKLAETLKYAVQIADALSAAHAAGIVHRDLKPGNVMVTGNGMVKILDFGLAKLTEAADADDAATRTLQPAPLTEQGAVIGTVAYMSPEQAEGKKVDARSDIFSFGSLLYEMLTGRPAFQAESKMSTITAILRDEPKPLSQTGEPVPRDLEKIIARCLRKDLARRFQHMDDVKVALEELKEESNSGRLVEAERPAPPPPRRSPLVYAALAVAGLAVIALVALAWRLRQPTAAPQFSARQLTQDTGLTFDPTISPDGKLVAYASDQAGEGALDIWVQQLSAGAQPIRLTHDTTGSRSPSFSPDGGQIAFWSQREGGGVYVMPALGGEQRLLVRGNQLRPRFSPDGRLVVVAYTATGPGALTVVPATGGSPRRLAENFYMASNPVWSPDGTKILFDGRQQASSDPDWWVIPLEGGTAVKTGAAAVLVKSPGQIPPSPSDWIGDYILYSSGSLWRLPISNVTGKIAGQPQRLTTGSGNESQPRAIPAGKSGDWKIVFTGGSSTAHLWSLAIDANAGKRLGEPVKLFTDAVARVTPSLSADGSRLVYVLAGLDSPSVRLRDLKSNVETTLLQSRVMPRARISPDGAAVATSPSQSDSESVIDLYSTAGGEARRLCTTCGLIYDWTPDSRQIIFRSGQPIRFSTVDIASGRQTVIVSHPQSNIHAAKYSPDGRWLAFHFAPTDSRRAIFLAPVRDGRAAPENEWIPIMDRRRGTHSRPWWSPDGRTLYFNSTAGGQQDLWMQRLDPATKRPLGEPVVLYHPQGERLQFTAGVSFGPGEGPNRIIFSMSERTGNIWIAE